MAESKINTPTLGGYKLKYVDETVTWSNGAGTLTHNLGTTDYIAVPVPNGNLFVTAMPEKAANYIRLSVAFVSQQGVADSKVVTNYTGQWHMPILFLYK